MYVSRVVTSKVNGNRTHDYEDKQYTHSGYCHIPLRILLAEYVEEHLINQHHLLHFRLKPHTIATNAIAITSMAVSLFRIA